MRALIPTLILLLTPAGALAAERQLTGDQIRDLAKREVVWCENYRPIEKDCESLSMVSLQPDGGLRETGALRMSSTPDLLLVVDGRSRIEGNRICSVYQEETTKLAFVLNGSPVPAILARNLLGLARESMEEFRGKTLCQSFYTEGSMERLREEVTVDGQRRPDLESVYRIQPDEAGLAIRAPEADPEESQA